MVKFLLGLTCLGVFVWGGLTVPLGERTLFGHLRAIGGSKESQDLVRGTRQKVVDVKTRIVTGESEAPDPAKAAKDPAKNPPQDRLTADDRKEMRRLIERAK